MTLHRTLAMASAFAMAFTLTACGGNGGSGIASALPPPPPPPPPPAPSLISAPGSATTGTGPQAVLAALGGPNFTTGPAARTAFPLLQTAMTWDSPLAGGVAADEFTNANGGTATVEGGQLKTDYDDTPWFGYADLDWTRVGYWSVPGDWFSTNGGSGAFVVGYQTPVGSVPTAGTASFTGRAEGALFYSENGSAREAGLSGSSVSLTADFGAHSVTGSVTGMLAEGNPWNGVAFSSSIAGNGFSGATRVTSAPDGIASLAATATGTIEGRFFGPAAQEVGAVWTLYDGSRAAIGTLSAKQGEP